MMVDKQMDRHIDRTSLVDEQMDRETAEEIDFRNYYIDYLFRLP